MGRACAWCAQCLEGAHKHVTCHYQAVDMMTLKPSRTCRPRVGLQEAHNLSDIQRFYIVMAPTSRKAPMRLAAVGKKQLPDTKGRYWACIQGLSDKVTHVPKLVRLHDTHSPTSTLGCSHSCGARQLSG